jgi:hypothetical protein
MKGLPRNPQLWRGEWDSNPRALSNMGLAIPRPPRLGDPRPHITTRFDPLLIILSKQSKNNNSALFSRIYWEVDDAPDKGVQQFTFSYTLMS